MEDTQIEPTRGQLSTNTEQSIEDHYIKLSLLVGGTKFVRQQSINELTHINATAEDRETLNNPYPRDAHPEEWSVTLGYDRYTITKGCYNKLKKRLEVVPL